MSEKVTAFAPATSANVAVGFDILGFAIEGLGDKVSVQRRSDKHIIIQSINGHADADKLPTIVEKNTAGMVIMAIQQTLGLDFGVDISIDKGIPLGSGLGGSAASAVAAAVAFNALLSPPLPDEQLIEFALCGEQVASGQKHGDNVIPCLLGGLQLTTNLDPIKTISLPIPSVHCTLVHPHMVIETRQARICLQDPFPLTDIVKQQAYLAGFLNSLYTQNLQQLQHSLHDVLVEPRRASLIPGFYEVQQAALDHGALAASISGAGPTLFALSKDQTTADKIGKAMQQVFKQHQLASDIWLSPISSQGARIIK